jgi:hypothetical protein
MTMFIDKNTQETYLNEFFLRAARQDISFPAVIDDEALAGTPIARVQPTDQPAFDATAQGVRELPPTHDGVAWRQAWSVYQLNADESAAAAAARMAASKAARQVAVDNIKVTTQTGCTFDGDEISQGRMSRAIIALDAAGQASTTWVLSNNVPTTVTRTDLVEALVLAGQEQTRLWMQPWA